MCSVLQKHALNADPQGDSAFQGGWERKGKERKRDPRYLRLWSYFEDIERARRAYDLVRDLGRGFKACTLLGWAKRGNAQLWSYFANTAWGFVAKGEYQLCP